jgi:hypothetical protein
VIKFQKLWDAHPTIQGDKIPCKTNGKINFEDQCAIRLGTALAMNGVNTTNLIPKGRHCWQHETSEGHVLAAEELANALARFPIRRHPKQDRNRSQFFSKRYSKKKGNNIF